jgi:predicted acetyltransferase
LLETSNFLRVNHEIRVLTDAQEVGKSLEVFLTAMVGLPSMSDGANFAEPGRTLGAFVGPAEMVGTASSFTSWLIVPGGARVPQAAVTDVGVLPTHTRQGLASALVRRQLQESAARGEIIASLRATEAVIYERFGYGIASSIASLDLTVARARLRPSVPGGGAVRLVDPHNSIELMSRIYAPAAWTGAIDRPSYWWQQRAAIDAQGSEPVYLVVHGPEGEEDGYARYRPTDTGSWFRSRDRSIVVYDLIAHTPKAFYGLLRYLLSIDLLQRVVFDPFPVDHSVEKLLLDERAARTTSIRDETWLRLVDVQAALAARTYRQAGEVVIEVFDEQLRENTGRYVISGTGVARTEAAAQLSLDVAALASVYLGGTKWWQLAWAGRVVEHQDGALAVADQLFSTDRAPFSGTMF